jgi:hypothetical protein
MLAVDAIGRNERGLRWVPRRESAPSSASEADHNFPWQPKSFIERQPEIEAQFLIARLVRVGMPFMIYGANRSGWVNPSNQKNARRGEGKSRLAPYPAIGRWSCRLAASFLPSALRC